MPKQILPLLGFLLIAGCSQNPEDLIEKWKKDGWIYVSTHGKKGDVKRTGKLQSDKAQAVEAAWVDRGRRKTKLYQQTSHYYAILRFIKHDNDEFVVVMKRRK
tara:strand:+ start:305 stop:613 length:309 start_codon:yes stop_codon:yes gene_type:complete